MVKETKLTVDRQTPYGTSSSYHPEAVKEVLAKVTVFVRSAKSSLSDLSSDSIVYFLMAGHGCHIEG